MIRVDGGLTYIYTLALLYNKLTYLPRLVCDVLEVFLLAGL